MIIGERSIYSTEMYLFKVIKLEIFAGVSRKISFSWLLREVFLFHTSIEDIKK